MPRSLVRHLCRTLAFAVAAPTLGAQIADPIPPPTDPLETVRDWIALDATPGRERQATDAIMRTNSLWTRDALGSLTIVQGSGAPLRVIACSLDQAGYVVSEVTPTGYLRLQYSGNARRHPLWDQFHEGQAMRIVTRRGTVPGVIGVRSTHLQRGRSADSALAGLESFWVDVGARSAAAVDSLGIALLDLVARDQPDWIYGLRAADAPSQDGRLVAGPSALARAGCAAIAEAAADAPARGRTAFVIGAQSAFGHAGLAAVLARLGHVDSLTFVGDEQDLGDTTGAYAIYPRPYRLPFALPAGATVGAVSAVAVPVRYRGTLVESISAEQLRALDIVVQRAAGVASSGRYGEHGPQHLPVDATNASVRDTASRVGRALRMLTQVYAVSEHEQPMRNEVRSLLPAWARSAAQVDSAGNVVVSVGPDRDTVVFIAHLDEIGFEVTGIAPDGSVRLRQRGGFYRSLWEGQPALLHIERNGVLAHAPLPGVFVPRRTATTRQPDESIAWFGLDSAALVANGATIGSAVTGYKHALSLAGSRFAARSVDDRAGCAAMLLAILSLDPATLTHKVVFAFSVREETGLEGATALAARIGRSVHRVYAVDTFVSSDYPGESTRFADLPLGRGAIVRALDNSSSTPPDEIDRVVALARTARIPIQVGTTNGGNDGAAFVPYGAIDVPLSWPARYSHSPVELIDLHDVEALARLIAALAVAK